MPKKFAPAEPKPKPKSPLKPVVMVMLTFGLAVFGFWVIAWIGKAAGDAVAQRDVYRVKFDDIPVPVPPGMDRETFLTEVKYLGNPPRDYSVADPQARQVLAEAFAKHPWVHTATPVMDGTTQVAVTFRNPVLIVTVIDGPERLVDAMGVLLPLTPWTQPLPRLKTPQPGPLTPAGEIWLNPRLPKALECVRDLAAWELTHTDTTWTFQQKNGKSYTLPLR